METSESVDKPTWLVDVARAIEDPKPRTRFDNRVFNQDKWWIDANRHPHLIDEMEPGHVRAVYEMIRDQEFFFVPGRFLGVIEEFLASFESPEDYQPFDTSLVQRCIAEKSAVEWVEDSMLARKLRHLIEMHESEDSD